MQQTFFLTKLLRAVFILLHLVVGITLLGTLWIFCKQTTKDKLTRWWCKGLLWRFNITVAIYGTPPNVGTKHCMLIANHVSWIDIHALNSVLPVRFIAKSDINTWPVFGYLARKTGTIFINRSSRKDTARIVDTTATSLINGSNVAFFPEGTTTDGTVLANFKSSIVQAAINANATIQPVAIRYPNPDGSVNTQLSYAGDKTMAESMFHALNTKYPVVELHFLPTIDDHAGDRQAITQQAQNTIAQTLGL